MALTPTLLLAEGDRASAQVREWFLSQFDDTFSLLTCPHLLSLPHRDNGYPALALMSAGR
jgi:hypothetical protein